MMNDASSPHGRAAQAARDRTQSLIVALTEAILPTRVAPTRREAALGWSLGALGLTAAGIVLSGPMRPEWWHDLEYVGFAVQLGLGTATGLACLLLGLEHDVPGAPRSGALRVLAAFLALAWMATTASSVSLQESLGLAYPPPSMLGKREHCLIEGFSLMVVPAFAALWLLAGRAVRPRFISGAWLGLAAGVLPALAMQLACMLEPMHALRFHMTPVFASALVAGLVARFFLPRD